MNYLVAIERELESRGQNAGFKNLVRVFDRIEADWDDEAFDWLMSNEHDGGGKVPVAYIRQWLNARPGQQL